MKSYLLGIEGIPFIIRFKTFASAIEFITLLCIEGIPFIIRFKTLSKTSALLVTKVLKVFHL